MRIMSIASVKTFTVIAALCVAVMGTARADDKPNLAPRNALPPAESSHDPHPAAPSPLIGNRSATIVSQAGIGGPVAYARSGVLELGGMLAWTAQTGQSTIMVAPTLGWFLTDNFELSAIVQYNRQVNGDNAQTFITGLIEPSFHLPIVDELFLFAGFGVGATGVTGQDVGFAIAPRLGMNILVGRSGILTPSVAWNASTNRSVTDPAGNTLLAMNSRWTANIGYSVMW
jgi:hypothetical protein